MTSSIIKESNMAEMISRRRFVGVVTAFVSTVAIAASADATASAHDMNALADASYLYIATVRRDGNQSKAAPVWFIAKPDGEILIDTNTDSWKAKRIGRGSPVLVWIGSRTGTAFIGKADLIHDPAVQHEMIDAIPRKYFLARIGLFGPKRAKFDAGQIVTIRISPARDLPDKFQSQPGTTAPTLDDKASSPAR
jgi:PPOX class probable F420-dependent enzyme